MRRKGAFILIPVLLALTVGCGKEGAAPAGAAETTSAEAGGATTEVTETSSGDTGTEEDKFLGLEENKAKVSKNYQKDRQYTLDAIYAVGGLDLSSFSGNDEIGSFYYDHETDKTTGGDVSYYWSVSLKSAGQSYSDQFINQLEQLIKEQHTDAITSQERQLVYEWNGMNAGVNIGSDKQFITIFARVPEKRWNKMKEKDFPGLNVGSEGVAIVRDYKEENVYFQDAMTAIAGLDFSSFAGNDEIKNYTYLAYPGVGTDKIEDWEIHLKNEDGFSDKFGEELMDLVQKQFPDSNVEMDGIVDGERVPSGIEYIYEATGAKVFVYLDPYKNSTDIAVVAKASTGESIKKDAWVTCSTDDNFNLMDTYSQFSGGPEISFADNSDFVTALIHDVFGLDFEELSGSGEISEFYITVVPYDDSEYVESWMLSLYSPRDAMFSDGFVQKFKSSCEENMSDNSIREENPDYGGKKINADYTTNDGRIDSSVALANEPGGRKTKRGDGITTTTPTGGRILFQASVNSDKYEKLATD